MLADLDNLFRPTATAVAAPNLSPELGIGHHSPHSQLAPLLLPAAKCLDEALELALVPLCPLRDHLPDKSLRGLLLNPFAYSIIALGYRLR